MQMDEKNGTTGSGSSGKKRGVLFGGAKRWSQGGQKDVELGMSRANAPVTDTDNVEAGEKTPHNRQASWDILRGRGSRPSSVLGASGANTPNGGRSGSATPRVEWEGFDFNTANSSVEQLRFAEGDVGKSKVSSSVWFWRDVYTRTVACAGSAMQTRQDRNDRQIIIAIKELGVWS